MARHRSKACAAALTALAGVASGCMSASPFADIVDRAEPRERVASNSRGDNAASSRMQPAGPSLRPLDEAPTDEASSLDALGAIGPDSTLEECVAFAQEHSPAIEAALRRYEAAAEIGPQVAALPDPRVTYGVFITEVETRVGPQEQQVGLSQTLPSPGTLSQRRAQADRRAAAAHERLEATRLEVARRVTEAFVELAYLRRAVALTSENIDLLAQFERVARARYRVAAAGHPDVIRAQLELGRLEDRLRRLRDLRAPQEATLNAAMGRPARAPAPWPETVPSRVLDLEDAAVLEAMAQDNPTLRALLEEVEAERIGTTLARKQSVPDLTLGVTYTVVDDAIAPNTPGSGDDPVLASVSMNLPVWRGKYNALVREAVSRRLAAAGARADARTALEADAQRALFNHRDAHRRVMLFRDTLIPKASESLRASLTGFESGTTGFLDLLDTERTLLEFQLSLARARADRASALARLEALVGRPLPTREESPEEQTP